MYYSSTFFTSPYSVPLCPRIPPFPSRSHISIFVSARVESHVAYVIQDSSDVHSADVHEDTPVNARRRALTLGVRLPPLSTDPGNLMRRCKELHGYEPKARRSPSGKAA